MLSQEFINTAAEEMLLSILNMKLRNEFCSLDGLANYYELDPQSISQRLAQLDVSYSPEHNQFKAPQNTAEQY